MVKTYLAFTNNLGSILCVMDENGAKVFDASYDAWGRQTVTISTIGLHRGYTGHRRYIITFNFYVIMLYFKFQYRHRQKNGIMKKKNIWRVLFSVLNDIFAANPDFENKIPYVALWVVEYENNKFNQVIRELGFDTNGKIIVKLPDERNFGFWIDSDYTMKDYCKLNIQMITEQEFNNLWNSVDYDRKKGEFKPVHRF